MIYETTVMVDRWLRHPEHGFEPLLRASEMLNPEGEPHPMPETPTLVNDMEYEDVVTQLDPARTPALVLFTDTEMRMPNDEGSRTHQRGVGLVVSVCYLTKETPPVQATLDGAMVLRSVRKSLNLMNSLRTAKEHRTLNNVKIASIDRVVERRVIGGLGSSQMFGFVLASVSVIDLAP